MERTLILGGPGCGKTTKLLEILEGLFEQGYKPGEIAFLTFTRRAAQEAVDRTCKKFGFDADDVPWFRTLHSYAFRALGVSTKELMSPEHYRVLEGILEVKFDLDFQDQNMFYNDSKWGQALSLDSFARASRRSLRDTCEARYFEYRDAEFVSKGLANYKDAQNLLDFTDLLEQFAAGRGTSQGHRVVFVDEAQDLSTLQWACIERITGGAEKLFVAGDDDQAIFAWAGADLQTFLHLPGERIVLPKSHRLPRKIWQVAQNVAAMISDRYAKQWEPASEGGTVERVSGLQHLPLNDGTWMVLARTRAQLRVARRFLRMHGYPYLQDGVSSVANPDVRSIMAWEQLRKGGSIDADDAKVLWARVESWLKDPERASVPLDKEEPYTLEKFQREHGLAANVPDWMSALSIRRADVEYYREVKASGESLVETPRITLATIHTVKGGEAQHVAVFTDIGQNAAAELTSFRDSELRVFYVAVSRAMESLWFVYPTTEHRYPLIGVAV